MKLLELKGVYKYYPKFTLTNVSFSVEAGSITGFIGRNGAGKTTTLKGIMNLLHFDSGVVTVFGRNFKDNELENRQRISFSLSDLTYFPQQKIKNLTAVTKRFYREWDDEIYGKLCKKFDLDPDKKVSELSSGMKVKYNLAVALSHNARLLIFDEPTSGLDPISRDEILDVFKSLVSGGERAILFSTHITSDLEKCADSIVYIKKGEIVASEKKEDFTGGYRLVSGDKGDFYGIKDCAIYHKTENGRFSALFKKDDAVNLGGKYEISIPDLETVMVYNERRDEDEEFDL